MLTDDFWGFEDIKDNDVTYFTTASTNHFPFSSHRYFS